MTKLKTSNLKIEHPYCWYCNQHLVGDGLLVSCDKHENTVVYYYIDAKQITNISIRRKYPNYSVWLEFDTQDSTVVKINFFPAKKMDEIAEKFKGFHFEWRTLTLDQLFGKIENFISFI